MISNLTAEHINNIEAEQKEIFVMHLVASIAALAALALAFSTLWNALVPNAGRILAVLDGAAALPDAGHVDASTVTVLASRRTPPRAAPADYALAA